MAERLSYTEKKLRSITEAEWQSTVIQWARINHWKVFWAPANRPGKNGHIQPITAGWPDLTFVREGEIIMAELKRELGKTTAQQDEFIRLLRSAGITVYVWRPSDDAKMRAILRRPN